MIVFRICKTVYAKDLSGHGAELYGGRWNSRGIPLVYTAESRSLCCLEIAVRTPLGNIPTDYKLITLEIPTKSIAKIAVQSLDPGWNSWPHGFASQKVGNEFVLKAKYLTLKTPSAVVPGDFNYLINPLHPQARTVTILSSEDFQFDKRLFE